MTRAMVIGARGQDGSYLCEHLTRQGIAVTGLGRDVLDVTQPGSAEKLIKEHGPDQIYYLAAFHHSSDEQAPQHSVLLEKSFRVHVQGLSYVLEAVRSTPARVFYAASAHVFGRVSTAPQDERTPLGPGCIYGITKAAGMGLCRYYRERHGVFAASGILYNHESPRRGKQFVTQRIVTQAKAIAQGQAQELVLGDLGAQVDWGWAPDYVDAMQRILGLPSPDDFIVATGQTHSIADFARIAFKCVGLDWRKYVKEDKALIQKKQNGRLCGSPAKLKAATGWRPTVGFEEMVQRMVNGE